MRKTVFVLLFSFLLVSLSTAEFETKQVSNEVITSEQDAKNKEIANEILESKLKELATKQLESKKQKFDSFGNSIVNETSALPDWAEKDVIALKEEIQKTIEKRGNFPKTRRNKQDISELEYTLGNFIGQALVREIDISTIIDLHDRKIINKTVSQSVFDFLHYYENEKYAFMEMIKQEYEQTEYASQILDFIANYNGKINDIMQIVVSERTRSDQYLHGVGAVGMTVLTGATTIWDGSVGTYDDIYVDIPIGFNFVFYRDDDPDINTEVRVATNGYMTMFQQGGGAIDGTDWTNDEISNTNDPDGYIGTWWDDLRIQDQGTTDKVSYKLEGSVGNRTLTVEYYSVSRRDGDTNDYHYFQTVLREYFNRIEIKYGNWLAGDNDDATCGMENYPGTDGDGGPNTDNTNDVRPSNNYYFYPGVRGLWTGNVNTDWNENGNWDNGLIPWNYDHVVIPSGCPNYPVLDGVLGIDNSVDPLYDNLCRSLTINTGASLINTTSNVEVHKELTVEGTLEIGDGLFLYDGSTVDLSGTIQLGTYTGRHGESIHYSGSLFNQTAGHYYVESIYLENGSQFNGIGGTTHIYVDGHVVHNNIEIDDPDSYFYSFDVETGVDASLYSCSYDLEVIYDADLYGPLDVSSYTINSSYFDVFNDGNLIIDDGGTVNISGNGPYFQDGGTLTMESGSELNCELNFFEQQIYFMTGSTESVSGGEIFVTGNFRDEDEIYSPTGGSVTFGGSSLSQIYGTTAFYDLNINKTGVTVTADSPFAITHDLEINSGSLDPNDNTIEIGGDWTNNVGDAGFIEGSGRVIFNGGNPMGGVQFINSNETFNILEFNGFGDFPELRINDASHTVTCNTYDWSHGSIYILAGTFTAFDLEDNGIYGTFWVETGGTINLYQGTSAGEYIDLNGGLWILGGTMNVYGGSDDSWWSYSDHAGIAMSEGILDFKDQGIKIHNGGFFLNEDITGGTIRTAGGFTGDRADFNPAGGTIELYSSSDVSFSHGAGSNFYNVNINKSATRSRGGIEEHIDRNGNVIRTERSNMVLPQSNLNIDGSLTITAGNFHIEDYNIYVDSFVDIYGTLSMPNWFGSLNTDADIYWRSGSNSAITNGLITIEGDWYFEDGTNAQLSSSNEVRFNGSESQFIYCLDDDAEFNDVVINKSDWAAWIHSSSTDTMRVVGDMTVTADDTFQVEESHLLIEGILNIEDTGRLFLEDIGGTMTNNSDFTLNGELNIDGGEVLINGQFSLAATGELIIDGGSFTINDTVGSWDGISGTINMSDGIYFSNQGPWFTASANSNISGGLIDVDHFGVTNAGNFEPTGGTVEISHNDNYYGHISCSNGNYFHDLKISGVSHFDGGFLGTDIIVQNNLEIESGQLWFHAQEATVYNDVIISGGFKMQDPLDVLNAGTDNTDEITWNSGSYTNNVSDGTINVFGNWTFADGTDAQLGTGNTVNFVGLENAVISCDDDDACFGSLVLNKTSSRGDFLEIPAGNTLNVSNILNIDDGVLIVNNNVNLNIGTALNVNDGGTLALYCSNGNEATISQYDDFYDFNIYSGGTISATSGIFEYMTDHGVYIRNGATIDPAFPFSNCTFQNGEELGTLLYINNDQTLTINNVNFPANTWSGTNNVLKTVDSGEVTFTNATGDFAGPDFEDDTFSRIHWDGFAPDLEITNVTWTETEPFVCDQITATVTIFNNGNESIPAGSTFYLDIYYNPAVPPINNEVGDQYQNINSGIPAGDFIYIDFYITWNVAETWNSYVQVDTDDNITELNETNNVWGPDIINWNGLPVIDDLTIQINADNAELIWTYPINVDYFNIYRSEEPYDFSSATIETSGVNNYTEPASGSRYFYHVTAVRDCTPTVVMRDKNRVRKEVKSSVR